MAITINTNTYAGEFAKSYIAPSILGGLTLGGNHLTIKANIKNKLTLTIGDIGDVIQEYSCNPSPSGTVSLDERVLDPKLLMVFFQNCKTDLIDTWASEEMVAGANNTSNPKSFDDFLFERIQARVEKQVDRLIWSGNIAGSGGIFTASPYLKYADGFFKIAAADSTTGKITATTLAANNILAEMAKVYAAIPTTVLFGSGELKWFLPFSALRLYQAAQEQFITSNSNYTINQAPNYNYKGITLIPVGMEDNKMFVSVKENLFYGTDLLSDKNEYRVIDESVSSAKDYLDVIMKFSHGVQYAIGADVVIYN